MCRLSAVLSAETILVQAHRQAKRPATPKGLPDNSCGKRGVASPAICIKADHGSSRPPYPNRHRALAGATRFTHSRRPHRRSPRGLEHVDRRKAARRARPPIGDRDPVHGPDHRSLGIETGKGEVEHMIHHQRLIASQASEISSSVPDSPLTSQSRVAITNANRNGGRASRSQGNRFRHLPATRESASCSH
jgi:hypothetical protein